MFLPAGSQDEVGQQINKRFRAFEIFTKITERRNYQPISTPVVEYAQTFTNSFAGMALQPMLKWFNHEGEIEVLRPDWTTAIARALVKQPHSEHKWCYQGSVFRSDKQGMESRQAGIEIVHAPSFLGESESLLTAVDYLNALEVDDYLIELGHSEIFEELTAPLKLDPFQSEKLRLAMHDKRKDEVFHLASHAGSQTIAEELTELVDAYGSAKMLEDYEKHWKNNQRLLEIVRHLKSLAKLLSDCGINEILVDLGRVKNLPYYCGTMFRGYLRENGSTCFSGGRYDKLYEQFDERHSAVGLAFDVDILSGQLAPAQNREKICLWASPESHAYAEKIRTDFPDKIVDIRYDLPDNESSHYDRIIEITKKENRWKVLER
ncbi:ATP phosphoribosyltransferase regulatory subunit [Sediminibacillus dalangtanensis]|uniref:ATP phosphoribosyltransferase regulatory subunit n=1 Tax=Sediminibacillus dalangtanensis TaxID=2729421 RepID=A0ABX7VYT9_9BACI|nr:ATP phosphoribosyltransferase regulatory subunit [Sediminibacillus dalangtanensis]QTM99537.1 ATP phosphoribosyltransferase regulatory subunit [Sediminibacillus dalangtanensis]